MYKYIIMIKWSNRDCSFDLD